MTDEAIFGLANAAPLLGWLALALAPLRRDAAIAFARFWSIALAVGYVVLIGAALLRPAAGPSPDLTTLAGIARLFADPHAALIGWFHYLALDLWTGAWEAEEAGRRGMPHAAFVPALVLTLLAGPAGLLLFLALRSIFGRTRPETETAPPNRAGP